MTDLRETLTLDDAARRGWDVLVVGAGPAGALAARQLARSGASVLLADQSRLPRYKVCGGCLSASALASLDACGLGDVPRRCGAPTLEHLHLGCGRAVATLALPAGAALSRTAFDAALTREAIRSGAAFLPECTVRLGECEADGRQCTLHRRADAAQIRASVVVAASGLGGPLLSNQPPFAIDVKPDARIGAGAVLSGGGAYAGGSIYMACGRGGYVGLTRLEDDRLNVAAAVDPRFARRSGGVALAIRSILEASPFPIPPELSAAKWRGTPPLTSRRGPVAAERVFLIGDATGYVEPFTGEGMAWALASANAVTPIVVEAAQRWSPDSAQQWVRLHARMFRFRRAQCRVLTLLLRRRLLTRALIGMLGVAPRIAQPLVQRISAAGLA